MSQSALQAAPLPAAAAADVAAARLQMVDTQLRPVSVSDPRILEAMRHMPRERFVPDSSRTIAYSDRNVPLGDERVLTEPRVVARLVQSLAPRRGERALVVGAATGYSACLLASLGLSVVALEQNERLAAMGRELLTELEPSVSWAAGPLAKGWSQAAPYDVILIDGGVVEIPAALGGQLATGGRVAGVLVRGANLGAAFVAEASTGGLRARLQFDAATPLLPELAPPPHFDF